MLQPETRRKLRERLLELTPRAFELFAGDLLVYIGLPVEFNVPLLAEPAEVPLEQIRRLIITNPLERFIIQGFLQYDAATGIVRFAPELWAELRHADVLAILVAADEQLGYYYGRRRRG